MLHQTFRRHFPRTLFHSIRFPSSLNSNGNSLSVCDQSLSLSIRFGLSFTFQCPLGAKMLVHLESNEEI